MQDSQDPGTTTYFTSGGDIPDSKGGLGVNDVLRRTGVKVGVLHKSTRVDAGRLMVTVPPSDASLLKITWE